MSSFLEELKQKLKSGNANAELKIVTGGNDLSKKNGINWGRTLGIIGGIAVIVMLVIAIMLFLNNQKEKNLNVVVPPPHLKEEKTRAITDLQIEKVEEASKKIEKKSPVDPNFTLLSDLL
jgi:hypothetical protein